MNFKKLSLIFLFYLCSIVSLNHDTGKNKGHLDAHSKWFAVEERSGEVSFGNDMYQIDFSKRKCLHIAQLENVSSVDGADGQKLEKIMNSLGISSMYFFSDTKNCYEKNQAKSHPVDR